MIAGITYNFLPFMVLPLYVSLEQIDHAADRGGARTSTRRKPQAFLRVTLPLSLPGVFAGMLLTFIPAAGDFINAQLLGTPRQYMIGNVIQSEFLVDPRLPDRRGALVRPDGGDPRRSCSSTRASSARSG